MGERGKTDFIRVARIFFEKDLERRRKSAEQALKVELSLEF